MLQQGVTSDLMDFSNFPIKLKLKTYYILPKKSSYSGYTITKGNPYNYVSRQVEYNLRLDEMILYSNYEVSDLLVRITDDNS